MDRKGIVNIINFIRAVDPRDPRIDLIGTVANQIELVNKHNFAATWLLQYDALIMPEYVQMLKAAGPQHEIGAWFETPQPLVEKAGIKWRGRPGFAWDWHTDVGFSVGYTPAEREKMADVFMEEFKAVFGKYPASVGSWFMDAHLIGYLADRYGVCSSCNCRDQIGTDGYTLWGGYWGQAFYPSRKNAYMPAQTAKNQIPVPVFRMLGSDPIYQYSANLGGNGQGVMTLEPVYAGDGGGGDPKWVRWFFDTTYGSPCLTFAYAQAGQENSFGWPGMSKGLTDQIQLLASLSAEGKLTVETLEASSAWFRKHYPVTPASAVTALTDWRGDGRKAVWYNSRFYRTNHFWSTEGFMIRDLHIFDENYTERYLTEICTTHDAAYDTLPICDGFVWSDHEYSAGVRLWLQHADGSRTQLGKVDPKVSEDGQNLRISWKEDDGTSVKIVNKPDTLEITITPADSKAQCYAELSWADGKAEPIKMVKTHNILYTYEHFDYELQCTVGEMSSDLSAHAIRIKPSNHKISLRFRK